MRPPQDPVALARQVVARAKRAITRTNEAVERLNAVTEGWPIVSGHGHAPSITAAIAADGGDPRGR